MNDEIIWTIVPGLHPGDVYKVAAIGDFFAVARRRSHKWWDSFISPLCRIGDHVVPFKILERDRRRVDTSTSEVDAMERAVELAIKEQSR